MASKSQIEWTGSTWNPITGCTKISLGCRNCYAERMANRLKAMGQRNYSKGFKVNLHNNSLDIPLKWKKPQIIFVNSMSDLFHEKISENFILKTFEIMRKANWHQFQILTKRSERLLELDSILEWSPNIWMGVSVENDKYKYRIDHLRKTHSLIKFLSLEPLLGPLPKLNLRKIDWVIVGGESGPGARFVDPSWVVDIRDQCVTKRVPFFFKQWGGINKKKAGRKLDGKIWSQIPIIEKPVA